MIADLIAELIWYRLASLIPPTVIKGIVAVLVVMAGLATVINLVWPH